jgi:hypothetical protein
MPPNSGSRRAYTKRHKKEKKLINHGKCITLDGSLFLSSCIKSSASSEQKLRRALMMSALCHYAFKEISMLQLRQRTSKCSAISRDWKMRRAENMRDSSKSASLVYILKRMHKCLAVHKWCFCRSEQIFREFSHFERKANHQMAVVESISSFFFSLFLHK